MHDGAPCHQAKMVKTWLQENGINVLAPWPGWSPDFKPIENCWVTIKSEVSKYNPRTVEDLNTAILQAWCHKITPEYCEALIVKNFSRVEGERPRHKVLNSAITCYYVL